MKIDPEKIHELALSLSSQGQLVPILVTETQAGHVIIDGHRRFLAARHLGWKEIEAKVLPYSPDDLGVLGLAANIHRENLTPLEEARIAYHHVIELERDLDTVARLFGKSRLWLDNRLELHKYPPDLKEAIHAGDINLSVAKELAKVTDGGYRTYLVHQATQNGATALTARIWVDDWKRTLQDTGMVPTAGPRPVPEYPGGSIGIQCTGCAQLYTISSLRPLYFCADCTKDVVSAQRGLPAETS